MEKNLKKVAVELQELIDAKKISGIFDVDYDISIEVGESYMLVYHNKRMGLMSCVTDVVFMYCLLHDLNCSTDMYFRQDGSGDTAALFIC